MEGIIDVEIIGINSEVLNQFAYIVNDVVVSLLFLSGCLIGLAILWGVSKWM